MPSLIFYLINYYSAKCMNNSSIGIGLRDKHLQEFVDNDIDIDWLEIHSENFFSLGGPKFDALLKIREKKPIAIHGIGMSLGSACNIDKNYLQQIKEFINIIQPFMVSEHLSWSVHNGRFIPELLPLPYNEESFVNTKNNIDYVQDFLGINILLENPSSYFEYSFSEYSEAEFLNKLCVATGSKILLDLNNIYVSCHNNGGLSTDYLNQINKEFVKEIHLAGHSRKKTDSGAELLIDTHDALISDPVWDLYKKLIENLPSDVHTLIEWDQNLPKLEVLLGEAKKARQYMNRYKKSEVVIGA